MNLYEMQVEKELRKWQTEIYKPTSVIEKSADVIQKTGRKLVPKKVNQTVTEVIKNVTKTIMLGSQLTTITDDTTNMSLAEREYMVLHAFDGYYKTALAQGFGFGAGGVILGMADLPVLMGIKIKFMFDGAKLYGFDPELREERLFILHIFQLAFSGKDFRQQTFEKMKGWDHHSHEGVDWEALPLEYRDYIDFAKLLQLLPLVGSVAGLRANHKLMLRLRENLMNAYRLRLKERELGKELSKSDDY